MLEESVFSIPFTSIMVQISTDSSISQSPRLLLFGCDRLFQDFLNVAIQFEVTTSGVQSHATM